MNEEAFDARRRIDGVLDSVYHDRDRANGLFQYVWTVMCVRRGLLRVVEENNDSPDFVVVEEVGSGKRRRVARPCQLDPYTEGLAVQALARLIEAGRPAL